MARAALLVTVLILAAAAGVGVAGTGTVAAGSGSPGGPAMPSAPLSSLATDGTAPALQQSFDRSIVRIRVDADGSARWTFRYERTLETDQEREDFAAYAEEFNENETELYDSFRADATDLVAEGSNATGRDMAATNFSRDARIESSLGNEVGVVELSFSWEAFAEVDGDRVVVGDVFDGGLYVGPDQELVVAPGDGLVFDSVAPNGTQSNPESLRDSETVTWTGEQQFTDQRPRIVLVPAPTGATPTATESSTAATTPTATEAAGSSGFGSNWWPLVAAAALVVVGAIWYRDRSGKAGSPIAAIDPRHSGGDGGVGVGGDGGEVRNHGPGGTASNADGAAGAGATPDTDANSGAGTAADTGATADTGRGADATTTADAGGSGAAGAGASGTTSPAGAVAGADAADRGSAGEESAEGTDPDTATEPAVPDEAFLSDEDRVRKLLRENGGRMKQVRIVEETDWSKSKVSVLLSEMEEDDVISKLRVGRENVVSLEGHEPDAARSPFDAEAEDVDGEETEGDDVDAGDTDGEDADGGDADGEDADGDGETDDA